MRKWITLIENVLGTSDIEAFALDNLMNDRHYERYFNGHEWKHSSDNTDMMADEWRLDRYDPEFKKRAEEWVSARYREVVAKLNNIEMHSGRYILHRTIKVPANWPTGNIVSLGEYWSFDPIDLYAMWASPDLIGHEVEIIAEVSPDAVNWELSILANMDWYSGDSENELRLVKGKEVKVISIQADDDEIPFDHVDKFIV